MFFDFEFICIDNGICKLFFVLDFVVGEVGEVLFVGDGGVYGSSGFENFVWGGYVWFRSLGLR